MNQCLHCKEETKNAKFCSAKCSATYNNIHDHWRKKHGILASPSMCESCGADVKPGKKFCNHFCQNEFYYKEKRDKGTLGRGGLRRYVIERDGYKCSVCDISDWNNIQIVLEIEHKDGNASNNKYDNLCLICPNCHSQTSTYKGKNRGSGRHYRKMRYQEGKSY